MKQCTMCGLARAFSEFNKNPQQKDGLHVYCKLCCKTRWRKAHPNSVRDEREKLKAQGARKCNKCKRIKPIDQYAKLKGKPQSGCLQCRRENYKGRDYSRLDIVVARMWTSMLIRSRKGNRYKLTMSRELFITQTMKNDVLIEMHKQWVESGFVRAITPSIDRIDPTKGYSYDNIQFITLYENERKDSRRLPVVLTSTTETVRLASINAAARFLTCDWHTVESHIESGKHLNGWVINRS